MPRHGLVLDETEEAKQVISEWGMPDSANAVFVAAEAMENGSDAAWAAAFSLAGSSSSPDELIKSAVEYLLSFGKLWRMLWQVFYGRPADKKILVSSYPPEISALVQPLSVTNFEDSIRNSIQDRGLFDFLKCRSLLDIKQTDSLVTVKPSPNGVQWAFYLVDDHLFFLFATSSTDHQLALRPRQQTRQLLQQFKEKFIDNTADIWGLELNLDLINGDYKSAIEKFRIKIDQGLLNANDLNQLAWDLFRHDSHLEAYQTIRTLKQKNAPITYWDKLLLALIAQHLEYDDYVAELLKDLRQSNSPEMQSILKRF